MNELLRQRQPRMENSRWIAAVRSIGACVLCADAAVEAAHRDEGKGMGMKTHDHLTACLCKTCHTAIGNGPHLANAERRALMDRAIVLTIDRLVRAGKLKLA